MVDEGGIGPLSAILLLLRVERFEDREKAGDQGAKEKLDDYLNPANSHRARRVTRNASFTGYQSDTVAETDWVQDEVWNRSRSKEKGAWDSNA